MKTPLDRIRSVSCWRPVGYEPERSHLKIGVAGSPGCSGCLLSLIKPWLEQLRP